MPHYDEPFTPDNVDEQLEQLQQDVHVSPQTGAHLVQQLQQLYHPGAQADAQAVENVWERLAQYRHGETHTQPYSQPPLTLLQPQWEKRPPVLKRIFSSQRRLMGTIAALLVATILVGSLAVVLNMAHRSQQGATYTNSPPTLNTVQHNQQRATYTNSPSTQGIYAVFNAVVYKLDSKTGAISWQYHINDAMNPFYGTPTVVGNNVYAVSNSTLYVLNANTGSLRWKQQWTGNSTGGTDVFPLVRGNVVLIATTPGVSYGNATSGIIPVRTIPALYTLHALDTTTGKELWNKMIPLGMLATCTSCIAGTNNTLYILSNTALYAINMENGLQNWSVPVAGWSGGIVVADNAVYLHNDASGIFRAFSTQSGNSLWSASLEQGYQITDIQTNSSIVYLAAAKGQNYYEAAYDMQTGTRLWEFPVDAPIMSASLLNPNVLYISTQNGYAYALDVPSGKKLWSYHADGDFQFSTVDNNIFYLEVGDAHTQENEHAMADGMRPFTLHYIVALSKDGTELRRYQVPQNMSPQTFVTGNGTIYLASRPDTSGSLSHGPYTFIALQITDGKQLWHQELNDNLSSPGIMIVP